MKPLQIWPPTALLLLCVIALSFLIEQRIEAGDVPMRQMMGAKSGSHALAFSADGKTLAGSESKFYDGEYRSVILLWDVKTGQVRRVIKRPDHIEIWVLAFSPDGKTLAAAFVEGQWIGHIKLWDVRTGKLKRNLMSGYRTRNNGFGGLSPVSALAFSPDGKNLAVGTMIEAEGGARGEAFILDVRSGKIVRRMNVPDQCVTALAYSDGGGILAVASDDNCVRLCSPRTGKVWRVLPRHTKITKEPGPLQIIALGFSHKGTAVISVTDDQTLRAWSVKTGGLQRIQRKVGGVTGFPHLSATQSQKTQKLLPLALYRNPSGSCVSSNDTGNNTGTTNIAPRRLHCVTARVNSVLCYEATPS